MKLYLLILTAVLGTAVFIQLIPVRINIFFVRQDKDDFFTVRISTFISLLRFSFNIPIIQQKSLTEVYLETEMKAGKGRLLKKSRKILSLFALKLRTAYQTLAFLKENKELLSAFFRFYIKTVKVKKLAVHIRSGTGDAAMTGIICGLFWSAAGIIGAFLHRYLCLQTKPVLSINPDSRKIFTVKADLVISFNIFHLTAGGLLLLLMKIKGGKSSYARAPHTRLNEDRHGEY